MHHTAHALFEYAARGRVLFQKRRNLRFQFQKLNIQIRVNVPCVAGGIVWGARLKFFAARDGPAVKSHSTIGSLSTRDFEDDAAVRSTKAWV